MPAPTQLTLQALLAALGPEPQTASTLARRLQVSRATVHRKLTPLLDEGLAVKEGAGPQAGYRLKSVEEAQAQSEPQEKVLLEMDPATAATVQQALELYSRLLAGQLEEVLHLARYGYLRNSQGAVPSPDDIEDSDSLVRGLKERLFKLGSNASLGIFHPHLHPKAKAAWSVSRALRHRLAWDRTPEGSLGVSHDEPMPEEDLPHLEVRSGALPRLPVDLSRLPPGYLLQLHAGLYKVLGPGEHGDLAILGQSRSPQTAVQMAVNLAAGRPARSTSLR